MVALIRVTDDTTVPEIYECIALVSRTPWTVEREMRIDALLDEVLARRASMADAASA